MLLCQLSSQHTETLNTLSVACPSCFPQPIPSNPCCTIHLTAISKASGESCLTVPLCISTTRTCAPWPEHHHLPLETWLLGSSTGMALPALEKGHSHVWMQWHDSRRWRICPRNQIAGTIAFHWLDMVIISRHHQQHCVQYGLKPWYHLQPYG